MIRFGFTLLFAWFSFAAEKVPIKGYRVVFTTPAELVSALVSPRPIRPPEKTPGNVSGDEAKSRMQKYFAIKSKKVEGQKVVMEVVPTLPMVGTSFSDATQLELSFDLVHRGLDTYVYALTINSAQLPKVSTLMTVEPHKLGSLLSLELLSEGAFTKGFAKLATQLGFLATTPQEAEVRAQRENSSP